MTATRREMMTTRYTYGRTAEASAVLLRPDGSCEMHQVRGASLCAAAFLAAGPASGDETAAEILRTAHEERGARVSGVSDYTLVRRIDGRRSVVYYERVDGAFEAVGALKLGLEGGAFDGTPLARYAPGGNVLEGLQSALLDALREAGAAAIAERLGGAAPGQVASLAEALLEPSSLPDGPRLGSLVNVDSLRSALVEGAARAGMEQLAAEVFGMEGETGMALLEAVRAQAAPGRLLGELGSALLDGDAGGLAATRAVPGMQGLARMPQSPAMRGPGGPTGPSALHPAQAGIDALARLGGELMARGAMNAADDVLTPRVMADIDLYAPLAALEERTELRGRRGISGRDAWVLHAADLEGVDGMNALRSGKLSLWLDVDRYVPLRAEIEGEAEVDGDWRTVKLTVTQKNYRESSGMLFPSRTVTTVSGATPDMGNADSAELQRKLAQAKEQLERMPPAQRRMAEQMMNAQLGQMDAILGPGPMRFETSLVEARVNQGPPDELVQQVKEALAAARETRE